MIGLALDAGLELFHDPDQQGWANSPCALTTHWENYPLIPCARLPALPAAHLLPQYRREPSGAQAIRAAAELFEARALFDGEQECPVHLRVAEHGGRLYLQIPVTIAPGGRSRSTLRAGA